jgi:hypothetical protein
MTDPRDYKLDLPLDRLDDSPAKASQVPRPFLSVLFRCCGVYQRVYRDLDGVQYSGRCPRCGRGVKFVVGAGGTDSRAFVVE